MAPDLEARRAVAEEFKAEGNQLFKERHYPQAVEAYSNAINECESYLLENEGAVIPGMHVFYANRSFAHLRMENYGTAILDASKSAEIEPSYTKAYYRKGCAFLAMAKYKQAKDEFTIAAKTSPNDPDLRRKITECKKQLQSAAFAKAICSAMPSPIDAANPDLIEIPVGYDGPKYEKTYDQAQRIKFADELLDYQKNQKNVHKKFAYYVVMEMFKLLKELPTLVNIDVPAGNEFTVCGDVHGQYYDLMNIFQLNGKPSETNPYLFNGDFIDRGSFSVECILLLFAYKLAYPHHMHLARGNHESKNLNKLYGFEGEVRQKYDETLYEMFCEAFCALPLAHVINDSVFVVHGGLFSSDDVTLKDIRETHRFREPPEEGILSEILWSDPQGPMGRAPSKRGVGIAFGPDVTENFLKKNNLDMIVRSHEMKEKGYEIEHNKKLVTIFSAPNYCDQMGNEGAFIRFSSDDKQKLTPSYNSFSAVPHPPVAAMRYANPGLFGMGF